MRYLDPVAQAHRTLVDESIDRYLVGVAETVVRPRYPAPLQRELMEPVGMLPAPARS